ncbi:MAG: hypothetical protein ACJ72U_05670 [Nitrososphaeraceae archaeon]
MLGLIIDTVKTDRHFVSNHEMFGTLIKGSGLGIIENTLVSSPYQQQKNNNNGMNMNGMTMYYNPNESLIYPALYSLRNFSVKLIDYN